MHWICAILCCWLIYLNQVLGGYFNCTDSSTGMYCPKCLCLNAKIKYTCTLSILVGTTRWMLPLNQCASSPGNTILLSQAVGCGGMKITCNSFTASTIAVNTTTPCSLSQLEVTTGIGMDGKRVQCASVNVLGVVSEEYESLPITITKPPSIVIHHLESSNDSITLAWSVPAINCSYPDNYTISLSDSQLVTLPSETLDYTFSDLAPDTCYRSTVIANSCSGTGEPASVVKCTTKNPPNETTVSIIVQHSSLLPVQLQVVMSSDMVNCNNCQYIVKINDAAIQVLSTNYVVWPITVASPYFLVNVSSVSQAGVGPPSANINVSGIILNSDVVNVVLGHSKDITCIFQSQQAHYCVVCCSTNSSVPPDTSLYNVSSMRGSNVTVVLSDLTEGQQYYCKVAVTNDNNSSCFSPGLGRVQILIEITPGQIAAVKTPVITNAADNPATLLIVIITSIGGLFMLLISFLIILIIIVKAKQRLSQAAIASEMQVVADMSKQSMPTHLYDEVIPHEVLSENQNSETCQKSLENAYEQVNGCGNGTEVFQYHHVVRENIHLNKNGCHQANMTSESLTIPHVYATLEERTESLETDNDAD